MTFLTIFFTLTLSISHQVRAFGIMTSDVNSICDLNKRHAKSLCETFEIENGVQKFSNCSDESVITINFQKHSKYEIPKYGEHSTCKVTSVQGTKTVTTIYNSFGTKIVSTNEGSFNTTRVFSEDGYVTISKNQKDLNPKISLFDVSLDKEKLLRDTFDKSKVFDFIKNNISAASINHSEQAQKK